MSAAGSPGHPSPVVAEFERRRGLWEEILKANGPDRVRPSHLNELRAYYGGSGVWVDKEVTKTVSSDSTGVAVSLLHTGSSYADDLSSDGLLYHYPSTNRLGSRDDNEIEATKNAGRLGLPLFVVTYPSPSSSYRDVKLGHVEDWDDAGRVFLVSFHDEYPAEPIESASPTEERQTDLPFSPTYEKPNRYSRVKVRPGQARFRFRVMKRYGMRCGVCTVDVPDLLDAVHIVPKEKDGTDDPRNGLVLCATHHRAFDAHLFEIDLNSTKLRSREGDLDRLGMTVPDLRHLPALPHPAALKWRHENTPA